jgi:hypothetical protein
MQAVAAGVMTTAVTGKVEVTDLTIRDTSRILAQALMVMSPAAKTLVHTDVLYAGKGEFMSIGRSAVIERAAEILRKRNEWSRADAVEMAFDSLLAAGVERKWQRVGEVALLKNEGVARAFCQRREE